jgi:small-conductance mechanosensitive channel
LKSFDPFLLIQPLLLFLGTLLVGLLVRRLVFGLLRRWSTRTDSQLGDLLTQTLGGSSVLWIIILAFHLAIEGSQIPARYVHNILLAIEILWIWSITSALSRFAGRLVRHYGAPAGGVKSVTSLTEKLVQIAVIAVGLAWLAKAVFKTELTALWGTLGVGGLAVALALQDTLSNLFAGFYVSISGLVNLGDYVRLNSGEEGYITDITWRCTTMRTGANNLIVIPNNKLAQAIYTNYFLPDPQMGVSANIYVAFNSDIPRVMDVLLEETKATLPRLQGALLNLPPSVRFNGTNEQGLAFQVNCNVSKFADQFAVLSDLRVALYTRLQSEGIHFEAPPKAVSIVS